MLARRTFVRLSYKGSKLDKWIDNYVTSFTFDDPASGESDAISLQLRDTNKEWIGAWMPIKGDYVNAYINDVQCGAFLIDDMSFGGRPMSASIKGISAPADTGFKETKRSKTWEMASIQQIGSEIAKTYGLSFMYDADGIRVESLEQSEQTDSEFLTNLCNKYGLSMKLYSNKLIIFDDVRYEAKQAVATIDESEMLPDWSFNTTIQGTYTGGKIQYTDPYSEETIDLVVGDSTRLYESSEKADSLEDAKRIVVAAVNNANKTATTISFSLPGGSRKLYATNTIMITGLGRANGKYFINKVSHSVGGGYTITVEARKLQRRLSIA